MAETRDVLGRVAGLLIVGVTLLTGSVPVQAQLAGRIEVGKPFPPVVLPDLADGSPSSLDRFRGRKVMLHVFASW